MRVEEVFRIIDSVLKLNSVSNLIVLASSATLIFMFSLLLLTIIRSNNVSNRENSRKNGHNYISASILLAISFLLMFYGLIESISNYTITNMLVLGLVTYVLTLVYMFLKPINSEPVFPILLLFYINTFLFTTIFASKVLINGIDAAETTTDVLQIWFEKHFYFSRHAGWYDFAPIDAVLKNFLMNILGVDYPYDPLTTALMYTALAVSFVMGLFATIKKIGFEGLDSYALVLLLSVSNAYTLLLGMSTPPTNFSLVFAMFAIFLVIHIVYDYDEARSVGSSMLIVLTLLTIAAVLAHPMAIIIPSYVIGVLMYLIASRKRGDQKAKLFLSVLLISFAIFSLKAAYTGLSEGLASTLRLMMTAFVELFSMKMYGDIQAFTGSPMEPPKSLLISYTALPALLSAIFIVELIKKLRRDADADNLTFFTIPIPLLLTFIGFVITFVVPYSRYTAVPAVTLGAFQASLYLLPKLRVLRSHSLGKTLLAILIALMALISVLSPNALIEQYNIFTGGRWPRVENFVLSEVVFNHVDRGYIEAVFYGVERARLRLYFTDDILLYGHPYHHIECLIVEKLLIPGIINTRSYWDFYGRFFLTYGGFADNLNASVESIIFDGWRWIGTWS